MLWGLRSHHHIRKQLAHCFQCCRQSSRKPMLGCLHPVEFLRAEFLFHLFSDQVCKHVPIADIHGIEFSQRGMWVCNVLSATHNRATVNACKLFADFTGSPLLCISCPRAVYLPWSLSLIHCPFSLMVVTTAPRRLLTGQH